MDNFSLSNQTFFNGSAIWLFASLFCFYLHVKNYHCTYDYAPPIFWLAITIYTNRRHRFHLHWHVFQETAKSFYFYWCFNQSDKVWFYCGPSNAGLFRIFPRYSSTTKCKDISTYGFCYFCIFYIKYHVHIIVPF